MAKQIERIRSPSAEKFRTAADAYFASCDEQEKLYGEAGLALHMGVPLKTLRGWYDGEQNPKLQRAVQMAYLRIQDQIETAPAYRGSGMASRVTFLLKQPRFGGYQDRVEAKQDMTVNIQYGKDMDESDFL